MDNQVNIDIRWQCKAFHDLLPAELYEIIKLRNAIFVVEQNCVFQDADDKDQPAFHLCGWLDEVLVAYTRLLPQNIDYPEISIGRVVTHTKYRKHGIGKLLLEQSITMCNEIFGRQHIKIGAQFYLKKFYESFGFQQVSDIYLEDGIEHIKMILFI